MIKSIKEHYKVKRNKVTTEFHITVKDIQGNESTIVFDLRRTNRLNQFTNQFNKLADIYYGHD